MADKYIDINNNLNVTGYLETKTLMAKPVKEQNRIVDLCLAGMKRDIMSFLKEERRKHRAAAAMLRSK